MSNEKAVSLLQSQFIIYHSSLDALKTISLNYMRKEIPELETVIKIISKTCDEIKNGIIEDIKKYSSNNVPSRDVKGNIGDRFPASNRSQGRENPLPINGISEKESSQTRSGSRTQGVEPSNESSKITEYIKSNVSTYTFKFKDSTVISLEKSVLNKYPFFKLSRLAFEAGPNPEFPIYIDHPIGFFQIAYDYMIGKNIKIKRIDNKSKMHLYEDFVFYNISIPSALKIYNPKDQIQKQWKSDSFKVLINDKIYKVNKNTLKRRNLDDTYFSKRRDHRVGYDIDKDALTLPVNFVFYKYIDMYIRTGKITIDDNDMAFLNDIKAEFKSFGIVLDDKKWSMDTYKLNDMKGSTLITNVYGYYIHKWLGEKKHWNILFKATRDGFSADAFHKICDNQGETLILYSVIYKNNRCIFGSYNSVPWKESSNSQSGYIRDPGAFLFTLQNPDHTFPTRYICKHYNSALVYNTSYGPIYGYTDLCYEGELDNDKTKGKGYILDNEKQIYTCKNNNHIYSFICKSNEPQENDKNYSFVVDEMEVFVSH